MITDLGPPSEIYYDAQGVPHYYDPTGLGRCRPCERRLGALPSDQVRNIGLGLVAAVGVFLAARWWAKKR